MRGLLRELAAMVVTGLLCAVTGPLGSYALPLGARVARWELFIVGGWLFFRPVVAGGTALAAQSRLPRALAIALACALAALPTTLLVAWDLSGWRLGRVSVGDLAGLYPYVLLIGVVVTLFQLAAGRRRLSAFDPAPAAAPVADAPVPASDLPEAVVERPDRPASFLDRLPPALGRDLLALENEDHYVRAHTALGSTLILMRMRDAVAELAEVEGWRTHRSWWVARGVVQEVVRRDRALALRLANGLEVPVTRNEAPALRAAGWL